MKKKKEGEKEKKKRKRKKRKKKLKFEKKWFLLREKKRKMTERPNATSSNNNFQIWWGVKGGTRAGVHKGWKECQAATAGQSTRHFRFSDYEKARTWVFGENGSVATAQQHKMVQQPPEQQQSEKKRVFYDPEVPPEIVMKKQRMDFGSGVGRSGGISVHGLASTASKDPNRIKVYTDGCCFGNGTYQAKGGMGVYFGPNDKRNYAGPFKHGKATNNRAEMMACIIALEYPECRVNPVEIFTDSKYVMDCMQWVKGWKARGWIKSDGTAVQNQDLISRLWELIEGRTNVYWTHVHGHTGIEGNEQADALSKKGATMK